MVVIIMIVMRIRLATMLPWAQFVEGVDHGRIQRGLLAEWAARARVNLF